jgi:hypothetical protein
MEGNPGSMDLTIVVGAEGGIRMIADSDWPLDRLQSWHGAEMVYRVRRQGSAVRLEGRAGSRTCLFEGRTLNGAARGRSTDTTGSSNGLSDCSPAIRPETLLRPALPPAYDLIAHRVSLPTFVALPA